MARPRKYVQHGSQEVTGVSRMPDRRFYIILDGKRRYFRDIEDARAAYELSQSPPRTVTEEMELYGRTILRYAQVLQQRSRLPQGSEDEGGVASIQGGPIYSDPLRDVRFSKYVEDLADQLGVADAPNPRPSKGKRTAPGSPKVSDVLDEWRRLKKMAMGGAETRHIVGVTRIVRWFSKVLGDVAVCELTAAHFAAWREWVTTAAQKGRSPKWANDRHAIVKQVFAYVRRHRSEWPWPNGLTDWLDAYDRRSYRPAATNRQPFPSDEFGKLLRAADKWARASSEHLASETQRGLGQRRQALVKQKNGCS